MSVYYRGQDYYTPYLVHHGIKDQRWGVRRFQNPDGSLTEEGKKRYYNQTKDFKKSLKQMGKEAREGAARYYGRKDNLFGKEARVARDENRRSSADISADIDSEQLRDYLVSNAAGMRRNLVERRERPDAYDRYLPEGTTRKRSWLFGDDPSNEKIDDMIETEFAESSIEMIRGYKSKATRDAGYAFVTSVLNESTKMRLDEERIANEEKEAERDYNRRRRQAAFERVGKMFGRTSNKSGEDGDSTPQNPDGIPKKPPKEHEAAEHKRHNRARFKYNVGYK